jgi:hypothetical protein
VLRGETSNAMFYFVLQDRGSNPRSKHLEATNLNSFICGGNGCTTAKPLSCHIPSTNFLIVRYGCIEYTIHYYNLSGFVVKILVKRILNTLVVTKLFSIYTCLWKIFIRNKNNWLYDVIVGTSSDINLLIFNDDQWLH